MAHDEQERFITDEEGKELAAKICEYFGVTMTATTDTFNCLDGAYATNDGRIIGVEVKNMDTDRYEKYDDILIAKNKYDYASNKGKSDSGLTESVKIDYTKFGNSTVVFVTNFSAADGLEPIWKFMPIENVPNAPKKWQQMYEVPRTKARKYKITDGIIERI